MSAPPPPPPAPRPSLLRELADGTAGWVVLLLVSLALGVFLTGATLLAAYVLALYNPAWDTGSRWGSRRYVYPTEDLLAWLLVPTGGIYLITIAWLWTRPRRPHRAIWFPILLTVVITLVTVGLCVLIEEGVQGAEEFVMSGVILLAISAVLLIWVIAVRNYARNRLRPLTNETDGQPNVHCPHCGYRMVGLTESRCPECGTSYTLDQLLAQQEFMPPSAVGARHASPSARQPAP